MTDELIDKINAGRRFCDTCVFLNIVPEYWLSENTFRCLESKYKNTVVSKIFSCKKHKIKIDVPIQTTLPL
jgi:hypothetical protein